MQSEYLDNNAQLILASVATVIFLAVGWACTFQKKPQTSTNASLKRNSISPEEPKPKENKESKLRNVFSVKQRPPTTKGSSVNKDNSDRPFGSSYYYAHNNSNSKGGYADGLRAEDYVMNGPKLLSKGGVRVEDDPATPQTIVQEGNLTDTISSEENVEKPKITTASKQITRYLWDDDGDGDIAKIHIDSLPRTSTETIKWQEASISKNDVEVRLIGEDNDGFMLRITSQDQKKYHLHVPKMYGSADSVKAIVKKHKLLIKITKRKIRQRQSSEGLWGSISGALFGQTESYRSVKWPQLSATGGEIDEKMFKEVDIKDFDDPFSS